MASSSDSSGFGKYVPGFEFLQNLARQAAGGLAQGVQQSMPQMPNLGSWVAPTFNVEELDKRIQELKAVHFWLDQNSRALSATIQALEVQRMTLATLQGMNFNLGDVAQAMQVKPMSSPAAASTPSADSSDSRKTRFEGLEVPPRQPPAATPELARPPEPAPASAVQAARDDEADGSPSNPASQPPSSPALDPMQWWGSITQQFQSIASQALKEAAAVPPPFVMASAASTAPAAPAAAVPDSVVPPRRKPARTQAAAEPAATPSRSAARPASAAGRRTASASAKPPVASPPAARSQPAAAPKPSRRPAGGTDPARRR